MPRSAVGSKDHLKRARFWAQLQVTGHPSGRVWYLLFSLSLTVPLPSPGHSFMLPWLASHHPAHPPPLWFPFLDHHCPPRRSSYFLSILATLVDKMGNKSGYPSTKSSLLNPWLDTSLTHHRPSLGPTQAYPRSAPDGCSSRSADTAAPSSCPACSDSHTVGFPARPPGPPGTPYWPAWYFDPGLPGTAEGCGTWSCSWIQPHTAHWPGHSPLGGASRGAQSPAGRKGWPKSGGFRLGSGEGRQA